MFFLGVLAGWGNENTSGGAGLLLLILTVIHVWENKKVRSWMVTGMGGMAIGFAFLLLCSSVIIKSVPFLKAIRHFFAVSL